MVESYYDLYMAYTVADNGAGGKGLAPGESIRRYFPIFSSAAGVQGRALSYLDSAASSQKPVGVIERLAHYLSHEHANVHRGAYALSAQATVNYENARARVAKFIQAPSLKGLIFTRNTTESINLVAHAWENSFKEGDAILLTILEHHSNIVPWQLLAKRRKLRLEYVDVSQSGALNLEDFSAKLKKTKPKLLSLAQVSNSIGTVLPVAEMISQAHQAGCRVLVDAAQSVAHGVVNVAELGCDFLAFSGHKVYGPTGIGVLYASEEMLNHMEPFQGGGEMIEAVAVEGSTWAEPPHKFEAGTPAIGEAIALESALDFLDSVGREQVQRYEKDLFAQAFALMLAEPGVTLYGPATKGGEQAPIISFNVDKVHPHDLATIADGFNVQIRAGHHCAMPALKRLGLKSTARASIGVYSCLDDFKALLEAIRHARKILT